jgi:hypothetical protein
MRWNKEQWPESGRKFFARIRSDSPFFPCEEAGWLGMLIGGRQMNQSFGFRDVRLPLFVEVLMGTHSRSVGLVAVTILTITSVVGCRSKTGTGERFSGEVSSGSRQVRWSADGGNCSVSILKDVATIKFVKGKIVVENARVLLNDKEIAKVPADTKKVEVDYTAGTLTITADGSKVYEAELRE